MKKIFALILALILILAIGAAFAETISESPAGDPVLQNTVAVKEEPKTEAYSWEYLATIAGATAATLLIVQFLKLPIDKVWKIPTRIVAYIIALVIVILAQYFTDGLDAQKALLCIINAFVVALAAFGAYELTFAKSDILKATNKIG